MDRRGDYNCCKRHAKGALEMSSPYKAERKTQQFYLEQAFKSLGCSDPDTLAARTYLEAALKCPRVKHEHSRNTASVNLSK